MTKSSLLDHARITHAGRVLCVRYRHWLLGCTSAVTHECLESRPHLGIVEEISDLLLNIINNVLVHLAAASSGGGSIKAPGESDNYLGARGLG